MNDDNQAISDIQIANGSEIGESSSFFLLRSIAVSLAAITERLERIDDALRNTIGGSTR